MIFVIFFIFQKARASLELSCFLLIYRCFTQIKNIDISQTVRIGAYVAPQFWRMVHGKISKNMTILLGGSDGHISQTARIGAYVAPHFWRMVHGKISKNMTILPAWSYFEESYQTSHIFRRLLELWFECFRCEISQILYNWQFLKMIYQSNLRRQEFLFFEKWRHLRSP